MIFLFSYVSICRLFPDSSEGGKEPVDMRPDQEKVEAEIKPEHYDDDCGKAAVHIKSVKVLDVNRKAPGKNIPGGCGKYGTGNLVGKFQLAVGYIGIHHRKYQDRSRRPDVLSGPGSLYGRTHLCKDGTHRWKRKGLDALF